MEAHDIRVWAEEREPGLIFMTWLWPEDSGEHDPAADRRRVAATLGTRQRITSARVEDDGVLVRYDTDAIEKKEIADLLRTALLRDGDLKTRGNEMVRRVPTYLNLAQGLALDDRVSPLPGAARNMAARRGMPAVGPLAMIPGFRLVSRLHLVLPVLQSLASWSREAPPEVVNHHLQNAGLEREQLDLDHATAQEMMLFARDYSAEKAGQIGRKTGEITSQAAVLGRQWLEKAKEKRDELREQHNEDKP